MTDDHRDRAERDELTTAERLSSAPTQEQSDAVVGIGLLGWLRWAWRQLTSMRVALILLFLLSLAAVPGSIVPQTSASPLNVDAWHKNHKLLAPVFDKLGMFHVYSSFWFSAIYILLFISLVGCIIPRTWQFVGVLRAQPPTAPRHLVRLPVYATWRTGADADAVLAASHALLRRKRFRTALGGDAVAAEKGYLREVGNLLFHIALVAMLIAFAFTKLAGGMGTAIVVEGNAFSNNVTQYDDFSPSTFYTADSLAPFGFKLDSFDAKFQTTGPSVGQASYFAALVSYWDGSDSSRTKHGTIQVNHPLEVGGDNVYLTAHGFAPVIQVTDAKGKVIFDGPTPCLPQDANVTSLCAIKVNDGYTDNKGNKTQLGFSGIFAPTMADTSSFSTLGPHSIYPDMLRPQLSITGYYGDLGDSSGIPQSVYDLDTSKMKQYMVAGQPLHLLLSPEQGFKLPGGGTVTFTGVKQWANFTVAHNPGTSAALVSSVLAILGLIGSLFVQRRRVWVRAVTGPDGVTTVELAGLARSESSRIAEELAEIALDLQDTAPADADSHDHDHDQEQDPDPDPDPHLGEDSSEQPPVSLSTTSTSTPKER